MKKALQKALTAKNTEGRERELSEKVDKLQQQLDASKVKIKILQDDLKFF